MLLIVNQCYSIVMLGAVYALLAMGIWLMDRVIRRYDLSLEGSFGLGGLATALLIKSRWATLFAIPVSFTAGALIGILAGFLYVALQIEPLLAGIIASTIAFSLILLLGGSQIGLSGSNLLFSCAQGVWGELIAVVMMLTIFAVVLFLLNWLLSTQFGLVLQAVGGNPRLVADIGKRLSVYRIVAYILANGLSGLSGGLFVQYTGFFSAWAAVGVLLIGVAAFLFARLIDKRLGWQLFFGGALYQAVTAISLYADVRPELTKLVAAILIIIVLYFGARRLHRD